MAFKYAVDFEEGFILPHRSDWVEQAWGDVPVSYMQDDETLNNCSFLDLKINKWELSAAWSERHKLRREPMIRIEILRGEERNRFLTESNCSLIMASANGTLLVLELDEGGWDIDEILLLRLVSVFWGKSKIYNISESCEQVFDVNLFPKLSVVHERLMKCAP